MYKLDLNRFQKGCLIFGAIIISIILYNVYFPESDTFYFSKSDPENYISLFKPSYQPGFQLETSLISKEKSPVSIYRVRKDYFVQIFKISNFNQSLLKNIVIKSNDNHDLNLGGFEVVDEYRLHTAFRLHNHLAKSLYIGLSGDQIQQSVSNDTTFSFYAKVSEFRISYDGGVTSSIFGNIQHMGQVSNSGDIPIQTSFCFLRRKGYLYALIGYPIKPKNENFINLSNLLL